MTYFILYANGTLTQTIKPPTEEAVIAYYERTREDMRVNYPRQNGPRLFRSDSSGVEQYNGKTWDMVHIIEDLQG